MSEEELKNYIEKQRKKGEKERDEYARLAQSVLYMKVKNKTGEWGKAYKAMGKI